MEILNMIGFNAASAELIVRIIVACICGAFIGVERTMRHKEAGIRTHAVVALGSAVMMVVSKYGFLDAAKYQGTFDASRIAASVVTGVSFLGAGVIFIRGISIKGLTTAAGIWATSGIGIAVGAGMYVVGIASTVILLVIQIILHRIGGEIDNFTLSEASVTVIYSAGVTERLKLLFEEYGMTVRKCSAVKGTGNTVTLKMTVLSNNEIMLDRIIDIFESSSDIVSFSI